MLKTIDLFAGAGGLSLGFKMTGQFELVAAAEINANAKATYKKNLVGDKGDFTFIDNVVGYDFAQLNEKVGGIDIVIGGPPCQGFSNANRQKNHLISMNNGLVKEYFRAIKEIRPKAFVMENVSMLRSDTHRFYESTKDNDEIEALINAGFEVPKREDTLYVANRQYEKVDFSLVEEVDLRRFKIQKDLLQLLSVLGKNIGNRKRFRKYLEKHSTEIIRRIDDALNAEEIDGTIVARLAIIKDSISKVPLPNDKEESDYEDKLNELILKVSEQEEVIQYIVSLQKMIETMEEISSNGLIGQYLVDDTGCLVYRVNSYSVNDYVNAILGCEYIQVGDTVNAEWFGVPQERRRHIVIGIRRDLYGEVELELPKAPDNLVVPTVRQAIMDLVVYEVGYDKEFKEVAYTDEEVLSDYAKQMREGSVSVKNHITTRSTKTALERFKQIQPGKNFHSLSLEMKSTYSKPERTQNTIYLRLEPDAPSGTVVNVRKSMWIHPTLDRAVTVREAARLQSFPDNFEFVGTKDSQFQQVGNAVPPLLAKGIAEKVLEYISK
jgi:cytosine-specific methyltransferase